MKPHAILTALETTCWRRIQAVLPDFIQDGSGYKIVIEALAVLKNCGAVRQEFALFEDEAGDPAAAHAEPQGTLGRDPLPCDEESDAGPDPDDPCELTLGEERERER